MSLAEFEQAARDAANYAGEYLRERFQDPNLKVESKGVHDYVTECDKEAERRVLSILTERFPDHTIMAEESSPTAECAPYRWIVDPLDGTTNFIHGVPTFAVSVGMQDPEGLAAAAIYEPIRDEMFHAHRGGGAFLNGEPLHVSTPEGTHDSLLATGFPFKELSRLEPYLKVFEDFVRSSSGIRRAGSAAMDMAYVAAGRYDGFWEVGLSAWDVAAGSLLVREAGGIVTDVIGGDTMLESGDILAAGPRLHARMLAVTAQHFGANSSIQQASE